MDVEETLARIRHAARIINLLRLAADKQPEGYTDAQRNTVLDEAEALADAVANLDQWLSKGGFPPHEWSQVRRRLQALDEDIAAGKAFLDRETGKT